MKHRYYDNPRQEQVNEAMIASHAERITDQYQRGILSRLEAEHAMRCFDMYEAEINQYLGVKGNA